MERRGVRYEALNLHKLHSLLPFFPDLSFDPQVGSSGVSSADESLVPYFPIFPPLSKIDMGIATVCDSRKCAITSTPTASRHEKAPRAQTEFADDAHRRPLVEGCAWHTRLLRFWRTVPQGALARLLHLKDEPPRG